MCGIAGAWGAAGSGATSAMTVALAHRGPDDSGLHTHQNVSLGVRRLSIIDIANGAQPAYNETGEICVIANAEIYNHDDLRRRLQAKGHMFSSRCDTETIVHLYEEYGESCVEHLRGMFAFAIADGDRLLLARDRLGIKPLYYAMVPGGLAFASEIKALLRHPGIQPRLDIQAFADSRVLGYPVGDRTFVEGVRSLLPGHTLTVAAGPAGPAVQTRQYYSLAARRDESITFDCAQDRLITILREVVDSHLAADVDLGLILSGGLDSAVLAMVARDAGRQLRAFSVASGPGHPDLVQSTRIAAELGWPHETIELTFDDFIGAIPGYTYAQEVPSRLGGVAMYTLFKLVGAQFKACLNGEGADEVFGGYPEYLDQAELGNQIMQRLLLLKELGDPEIRPSEELLRRIDGVIRPQNPRSYQGHVFDFNMRDQLTASHLELLDKSAMAWGVEMRVPYMDHELVEFTRTLPVHHLANWGFQIGKHVLKRAALRAWGGDGPIADSILRRKIGAPSAGSRLLQRLKKLCEQELPDDYLTRHELGAFFPDKTELLLHELFCEIFLTGRGASPQDLSMRDFIAERAGRSLSIPA